MEENMCVSHEFKQSKDLKHPNFYQMICSSITEFFSQTWTKTERIKQTLEEYFGDIRTDGCRGIKALLLQNENRHILVVSCPPAHFSFSVGDVVR